MRQSLIDPQSLNDLAVIERHAAMAKKVLRDLLDFARPRPATPGPCDLGALIASLARIFEVQGQSRRVALDVAVPDDLPLAKADATALEQVLSNLLLNALDAVAPDTGRIALAAKPSPDRQHVALIVADNGPGIPPADLPHIFDPFFTTKDAGRGSGLGLAVAYGLMRDMNGTIEVANDGGAVFTLTLPACYGSCQEETT